jgi:hypothetical protein
MTSPEIDLSIAITEADADDERLDELTGHLMRDLRDLGVDSVERPETGVAPEGSKGDAFTIGALAMAAMPAVLPNLVRFLQSWTLSSRKQRAVKIKTPSGLEVEFTPEKRLSKLEILELVNNLTDSQTNAETNSTSRNSLELGEEAISRPIKILFLAANPKDTHSLRLDEEIRSIDRALRQAEFRDKFDIEQQWAVRVSDLQDHFLRFTPDIVHFSGHGSSSSEIILEDLDGSRKTVSTHALSNLFDILKDNIRCVVLNACYSEKQAQAIAEHIDCVVGMTKAIGDEAAINFATGFYRALGYGRDVQTAFELGKSQIDLGGLDEEDTPKLLAFKQKPNKVIFVHDVRV